MFFGIRRLRPAISNLTSWGCHPEDVILRMSSWSIWNRTSEVRSDVSHVRSRQIGRLRMSDLAKTPEIEVRGILRVLATLYLLVGRFKVHATQQPEWLYHTTTQSHTKYIFISVCVLVYAHMYTCSHTHHTRTSVHLSGRMRCNSRDDYTTPHTHTTLCMYIYMYIHLCVFIHVQIYMYIHTYTHKSYLHVGRFQRVHAMQWLEWLWGGYD